MVSLLDAALQLHAAGCCVVRARADGTKAPEGAWAQYQVHRPDEPQVRAAFANGHPGIGIITGAVSGNLEMLELEARAVAEGIGAQLGELMDASDLGPLWQQLLQGWIERTPSGGLHLHYRVDGAPVAGNTKLARRPATPAELAERPGEKIKVLIETRGEGGFTICAPSHGSVHPSGQPYELIAGGPETIPTISGEEYVALHQVARLLDAMPIPAMPAPRAAPAPASDRPGDAFEAAAEWDDILCPHGWTRLHTQGRTGYWRRPGKRIGVSATTGHADDRDRLWVFSTSTEFEAETPYSKFGAYALLEHGGDYGAAARALREQGYGASGEGLFALSAPLPAPLAAPQEQGGQEVGGEGEEATPEHPNPAVAARLTELRTHLHDSEGLDSLGDPEPLVDGVLFRNSECWLSGDPGSGKSFVAIDLAGAVSTGRPWQDRETRQGPVLYLVAEGAAGMRARIRAWEEANGLTHRAMFLTVDVQFLNAVDVAALLVIVAELRPALIVVDTQARVTVGANENDGVDMGLFVSVLVRMRALCHACVLVIHHSSAAGKVLRGHSSLSGAADSVIGVKRDEFGMVIVTSVKQKHVEDFEPLHLRLAPVGHSAVLMGGNRTPMSPTTIGELNVLKVLREAGDWVSTADLIGKHSIPKATAHRAIKGLTEARLIEKDPLFHRYRIKG